MDHIYEYFEQKRSEFKQRSSGGVTGSELDEMFQAAPDGKSGLIVGNLKLDEDAYIGVFERVVLVPAGLTATGTRTSSCSTEPRCSATSGTPHTTLLNIATSLGMSSSHGRPCRSRMWRMPSGTS